MVRFRRFVASSPIFSGYEVFLDIDIHNTLDKIINQFYDNLYKLLELYKFEVLVEELKNTRFHIHDITMDDITMDDITMDHIESNNSEKIIYVCDKCSS
jgi:hypothetical protein